MIGVREATGDDSTGLARLRWMWSAEGVGESDLEWTQFQRYFHQWMLDNRTTHTAYLAEQDGEPVGMAWLAVLHRVPDPSDVRRVVGDMQSVYVVPHLRGRGAGTLLINAVVAAAAERGLKSVSVRSGRRASALYQRLGFAGNPLLLDIAPAG